MKFDEALKAYEKDDLLPYVLFHYYAYYDHYATVMGAVVF